MKLVRSEAARVLVLLVSCLCVLYGVTLFVESQRLRAIAAHPKPTVNRHLMSCPYSSMQYYVIDSPKGPQKAQESVSGL